MYCFENAIIWFPLFWIRFSQEHNRLLLIFPSFLRFVSSMDIHYAVWRYVTPPGSRTNAFSSEAERTLRYPPARFTETITLFLPPSSFDYMVHIKGYFCKTGTAEKSLFNKFFSLKKAQLNILSQIYFTVKSFCVITKGITVTK